jgi:hypothetical protein
MTNEELVEETLIEAHKLGLTIKVFEIVNSLSKEHNGSRADIYDIALKIAKNNEKLVYSTE